MYKYTCFLKLSNSVCLSIKKFKLLEIRLKSVTFKIFELLEIKLTLISVTFKKFELLEIKLIRAKVRYRCDRPVIVTR